MRKLDGAFAQNDWKATSLRLTLPRIGVTFQQVVQKYEKGINRIGAGRLQRISEALDVPITFFFDAPPPERGVTGPESAL
jgi:transcriptional regulator with XRE-family HTH domain